MCLFLIHYCEWGYLIFFHEGCKFIVNSNFVSLLYKICLINVYCACSYILEWNLPEGLATIPGIVGYIVVSGPRFYQLCPKESRNSWFAAFKKSNFECTT